MTRIAFTVHGEPKPAGSKQSFPVLDSAGNVVRSKSGRIITRVKHDNPKTVDWMARVAQRGGEIMDGAALMDGPLRLTLTFFRTRPLGHYGTGRNAAQLKDRAPDKPTVRPDTVKLTRAVEDALTGVVWRDDSQVTTHLLKKRYGEFGRGYCVEIVIEQDCES